jgi:predicted nucleic acid-binding protein
VPEVGGVAVVDASAVVDLLVATDRASAVRAGLAGKVLHAPALLDAEVLSALGRLHRAGLLETADVEAGLRHLEAAPIVRDSLPGLLVPAWALRESVRLTDALCLALAAELDVQVLTTDARLARASERASLIG